MLSHGVARLYADHFLSGGAMAAGLVAFAIMFGVCGATVVNCFKANTSRTEPVAAKTCGFAERRFAAIWEIIRNSRCVAVPRNVRHGSGDRDRGHARPALLAKPAPRSNAVDGTHDIAQLIVLTLSI